MIDDPNFSLGLGHAWRRLPGADPGHYAFRDDDRDIALALSAMALATAPDGIAALADMVVALRIAAESDAAVAFDRRLTVYEPINAPQAWGRAVAYYGHDDTGRQFGYSGSITCRSVISLYMSSGKLSERDLMQAMDKVGSKIEFDRTPLNPDIRFD